MGNMNKVKATAYKLPLSIILISLQILISSVYCQKTVDECKVHGIFNDVTIYAGMKAGLYIPYDNPGDLAQMTVIKCTVHCCKKPDIIDIVFLLNKYCYCVSCYSAKLCKPVAIDPPKGFHPVAVILNKDILKFVSPSTSSGRNPKPWVSSGALTNRLFTKKFTRLFSRKHHPRVALIFRYVLCFVFGGLIGLIPYFIFLVELCKGLQYSCIQEYAASLAVKNVYLPASPNGGSESLSRNGKTAIDNLTKLQLLTKAERVTLPPTPVPTTVRTTLAPTRIGVKERTAEGKGNDDISIQCRGTMKITRVFAFGIVGDTKTVTEFDKYCQVNIKDVDNTKVCIISLKRVYKTNYPPFISTKVTYKCSYVTRDKAEPA